MIWGSVRVESNAIITRRATFILKPLSVFDVERPFRIPAFILSGAFIGFTAVFVDLLYPIEIAAVLGASSISIIVGMQLSQLMIHGGELRGSSYGHVVWGSFATLNKIRSDIEQKLDNSASAGNANDPA